MDRQRFQFRREYEIAAAPSIGQRLLAEAIAAQRKRLLLLVPQREGEHTDETLQRARHPPMPDGIQQRLRIGVPAPVRAGSACLELAANIEVIIDLAVESDREAPAVAGQRLGAVFGGIENRQSAMGESNDVGSIGPQAAGIGAAMVERVRHSLRMAGERAFVAAAGAKQAGNSTHQSASPDKQSRALGSLCKSFCKSCHCWVTESGTGFSLCCCINRLRPSPIVAMSTALLSRWIPIPVSAGRNSVERRP